MKMISLPKESLITFANRAIGMATIMQKTIQAYFNGVMTLIYPDDNYRLIIRDIRRKEIEDKIAQLEAQMA